jgi:hypothetical protein
MELRDDDEKVEPLRCERPRREGALGWDDNAAASEA